VRRRRLRIGTRGSRLSLRQTDLVVGSLREHAPEVALEIVVIETSGDRAPTVPLEQLEGIGFFAKDIELALLDGRCDLAVHSAKDLPTEIHAGLALAAFPPRSDARDVLISREAHTLERLPAGSRVATSSLRRSAQIRRRRPDLLAVSIRGNIDTRLHKLDRGVCDALCLAGAGLVRMGWEDRITQWLSTEVMLPAPGQGAIAVEARAGDGDLVALLGRIDHSPTRAAVEAERAFVARLGSGCRAPAAALGRVQEGELVLEGLVASVDGSTVCRHVECGPAREAARLGIAVADHLLVHAGRVLDEIRAVRATAPGGPPHPPDGSAMTTGRP
jgi:hydroxymethylbilane synthase